MCEWMPTILGIEEKNQRKTSGGDVLRYRDPESERGNQGKEIQEIGRAK